ncbi:DUF2510 domain-containing protein [Streptomyces sp. NPDC020898]|uniref:DUF2510 domain-containing protein n=1 Tax=Streptomyces sp. NPDC020898 TaxID=3365101 RepID=UPI0037B9F107
MSTTPPPGWYRDPSAPHVERWWDGTAWTEHRRAPEAPAPPPQPGGGAGTGRARGPALAAAAGVLVAAIVIGALVLSGGDDTGTKASTGSTGTSTTPSPAPTTSVPDQPPSSAAAADDPTLVTDELNGITFPLLDGWVRPEFVAEDNVVMTTDGTYDCPGDPGVCRHGRVISRTVTENAETSPEALARADIADAADDAYDRDLVGSRPFGGLTSHRVVGSGTVAVAGRAGYFVRWRVTTETGPGGYVQSLAFPTTVGTGAPVIVRFVFDAGTDGPPLADLDRITKGIRPIGDTDTGGGVGSSIGPSN